MQHKYIPLVINNKYVPQPEKQQAQPVENARLEMALSHCRLVSSPAFTLRDLMDGKGIQGLALHPKARLWYQCIFSVHAVYPRKATLFI